MKHTYLALFLCVIYCLGCDDSKHCEAVPLANRNATYEQNKKYFMIHNPEGSKPSVEDGDVLYQLSSTSGGIFVIDRDTGSILQKANPSSGFKRALLASQGKVFAVAISDDGNAILEKYSEQADRTLVIEVQKTFDQGSLRDISAVVNGNRIHVATFHASSYEGYYPSDSLCYGTAPSTAGVAAPDNKMCITSFSTESGEKVGEQICTGTLLNNQGPMGALLSSNYAVVSSEYGVDVVRLDAGGPISLGRFNSPGVALNAFAMDERGGYLRMMLVDYPAKLVVLNLSAPNWTDVVGSISFPNPTIVRSAAFTSDKAYVTTSESSKSKLYVIDTSQKSSLSIQGDVSVEDAASSSLYVLGADKVLEIGRSTQSATNFNIQLTLYDVSNAASPTVFSKISESSIDVMPAEYEPDLLSWHEPRNLLTFSSLLNDGTKTQMFWSITALGLEKLQRTDLYGGTAMQSSRTFVKNDIVALSTGSEVILKNIQHLDQEIARVPLK